MVEIPVSKQSTKSRSSSISSGGNGGGGAGKQDENQSGMMAGASNLAHEAADSVMHAASSGASSVKRQVTQALDKQVASGADVISQVASSTRRAADDLEREVPQLAGVVRSMADKVDTYADDLKTKSVDDLVRSASDFARRQPAAVFGFAAIAGFLVYRMLTTASEQSERRRSVSDMGSYPSRDRGYRGSAGNMGESGDYIS
jgi:hypothetical protein